MLILCALAIAFLTSCASIPSVMTCVLNPIEDKAICKTSGDGVVTEQHIDYLENWIAISPEDYGKLIKAYKKRK